MKYLAHTLPTFTRLLIAVKSPVTQSGRLMRQSARGLSFIGACLLILAILFYAEERWRWRGQWNSYVAQAQAEGKRLDLAQFERPAIPDEKNFAAIPFFRDFALQPEPLDGLEQGTFKELLSTPAVLESRGPLSYRHPRKPIKTNRVSELKASSKPAAALFLDALNTECGAIWAQLQEASTRPGCKIQIRKETVSGETRFHRPYARIRKASELAGMRLYLDALNNDGAAALDDLRILLRVANAFNKEPTLGAAMTKVACMMLATNGIWAALTMDVWDDAALAQIQEWLSDVDLVETLYFGMEAERAQSNAIYSQFAAGNFEEIEGAEAKRLTSPWRFFPLGWVYRNQLMVDQSFDQVLKLIDPSRHTIEFSPSIENEFFSHFTWTGRIRDRLFLISFPSYQRSVLRAALAEASVRQARAACALQRYRLKHGDYPDTLAALVAEHLLPSVPLDPMSNAPMEYQRTESGKYALAAIETDSQTYSTFGYGFPHAWEPAPK